jgi:hypothetical protein
VRPFQPLSSPAPFLRPKLSSLDLGERAQHLRIRVRLDGVEHAGVRQGTGEGGLVVAHDVEVEDHARALVETLFTAGAEKLLNTVGHRGIPSTHAALAHAFTVASWMTMRRMSRGGDANTAAEPPAMTIRPEP